MLSDFQRQQFEKVKSSLSASIEAASKIETDPKQAAALLKVHASLYFYV
jgi:hypothetical protein